MNLSGSVSILMKSSIMEVTSLTRDFGESRAVGSLIRFYSFGSFDQNLHPVTFLIWHVVSKQ